MGEISREAIIEAARAIASRMGLDTLRREDFFKESKFTQDHLNRLFPDDGWRGVLEGADLRVTFQNIPTPDEALLADFHRVVMEMGWIPTGIQYNSRGEFSFAVFKKRLGGIRGTLTRYNSWLKQNVPDAPELELVQIKSRHEIVTQPSPVRISAGSQQWAKGAGVVFGAPISFRGLRHAPTNEQGVVYLFGMVSSEIGLIVEAVQSAYPDCEAKRCIDSGHNRWQRVRIEFEFCSSNFKEHGHDPAGCDIVVCWEHDWPDCPLEVIELRSVIGQLEG